MGQGLTDVAERVSKSQLLQARLAVAILLVLLVLAVVWDGTLRRVLVVFGAIFSIGPAAR